MDFTRPFFLRAADATPRAVLLIHGLTGSPYELHLLGQNLKQRGYVCAAPLLAGHHASLAELAATRWPDWLKSAEDALHKLWKTLSSASRPAEARTNIRPEIALVGLSLGGLLALELGRRYPALSQAPAGLDAGMHARPSVSALCVLSAPLSLWPWQTRAIHLCHRTPGLRQLFIPKLFGADLRECNRPQPPLRPRGMPITCLRSLLELIDVVSSHLDEVEQPTLLCHGVRDHTVPYASMAAIAARIGTAPEHLRCLGLPQSYHLVTLDVEREIVFDAIATHLDRYLNLAPPVLSR